MRMEALLRQLEEAPVIAAVKEESQLEPALNSQSRVVFLLSSDILTVGRAASRVKAAGKVVFVHIDLVHGLAPREVAVDFLRENTPADGVISTKPQLIRRAGNRGLLTVQRFFLLDSMALENIRRQMEADASGLVEVLPGVMPKVIRRIVSATPGPVIAGGLIADKEDVVGALGAGATAVSTTRPELWNL